MMQRITRLLVIVVAIILVSSCNQSTQKQTVEKVDSVDPYIGSGGHGHVFVGANVPFGAVQLGPSNVIQGWDWCSGYHYSDSILLGFSHMHLSGTGIGDLGDVLMMPVSGDYNPGRFSENPYDWKALYSHDNESVSPGYYSLNIDRFKVDVELTTSERVGFQKYNYKADGNSKIILDLNYGIGWDKLVNASIEQVGKTSIQGHRYSTGWSKDQRVYFYTEFSKKIEKLEIIDSSKEKGKATAIIEFEGNGDLLVKTGISPVDTYGAKKNLAEVPHWDFELAKSEAEQKWNTQLAKINIETKNEVKKTIFYYVTLPYHVCPLLV